MEGILLRIIIAVICVVALVLVIPPLFTLIGFPLPAEAWTILRVCIAALALLYIVRGWPVKKAQP